MEPQNQSVWSRMECLPRHVRSIVGALVQGASQAAIVEHWEADGLDPLLANNLVDIVVLAIDAACDVRDQKASLETAARTLEADAGIRNTLARWLIRVTTEAIGEEAEAVSNQDEITDLHLAWCIVDGIQDGEDRNQTLNELIDAGLLCAATAPEFYEGAWMALRAADAIHNGADQNIVMKQLEDRRQPGFVHQLVRQLVVDPDYRCPPGLES